MKKIFLLIVLILSTVAVTAQENGERAKKGRFSPEEFKAKQQKFITEKAKLTEAEAELFFPLFFELQKKKFEIERNARKGMFKKRNERPTDEECREYVNKMAESKIAIAKLEKEYTEKYMKVIPACKIMEIQRAENMFQRHLMNEMMPRGPRNGMKKPQEKR